MDVQPPIAVVPPNARSTPTDSLPVCSSDFNPSLPSCHEIPIEPKLMDPLIQAQDLTQSLLTSNETENDVTSPQPEYNIPPPPEKTYADADQMTKALKEHALKHGYAISIRRSVGERSKTYKCERGGNYDYQRSKNCQRRGTSRLIGCGFRVDGSFSKKTQLWHIKVKNPVHNHPPRIIPPSATHNHHPRQKKSSNSYHQDPNPQSVDHHPSLTSNAVLSSSGTEFCMQEIPSSSSIPAKPLPNLPSLGHVQKEPSIPTDLPVPDWKERWQEIKLKLESLEPVERDICIQEVWKIVLAHQRSSQIPSSSLSSQINPQLQHDSRLLTGN